MKELIINSTKPITVVGIGLLIIGIMWATLIGVKKSPEYLKAQEAFNNNAAVPFCEELRKLKVDAMTVSVLRGLDEYKVMRLYNLKVTSIAEHYKQDMKKTLESRNGHNGYIKAYSDGIDRIVNKCARWD